MPLDDTSPLDDRDEFMGKDGIQPPTPEEMIEIAKYLAHEKTLRARRGYQRGDPYRWPQTIIGTLQTSAGQFGRPSKQMVEIQCQFPGCPNTRMVYVSDLFQVDVCEDHRPLLRRYRRYQRAQQLMQRMNELGLESTTIHNQIAEDLDDQDEFVGGLEGTIEHVLAQMNPEMRQKLEAGMRAAERFVTCQYCGESVDPDEMDIHGVGKCDQRECPRCGTRHNCVRECLVSDLPVTEELGGMRPAHLLIKAKHDLSWLEYVDAEGNTKYMQVHDVRSARDAHGRWAVYGINQDGETVHELYDLRHGYEHSGAFSGVRELTYGEIVKLAQQGVIRGEDKKPITTLSGLMRIADEPLRKLIVKKAKEAKAGGPSLEDIEKQIFAEPAASSAQKRRTGKAGTRPWSTSTSL